MGTLNAIGRKIRGITQQVQGTIQQNSGEGFKGGIQKLKGKTNELIADIELNANKRNQVR